MCICQEALDQTTSRRDSPSPPPTGEEFRALQAFVKKLAADLEVEKGKVLALQEDLAREKALREQWAKDARGPPK